MKTLIVCLFVVSSLLSVSSSAWAWGKIGHRVTGEIATAHLSPKAQAAINALYPKHTLAEISALADFNRSNPADFWQKESTAFHYVTVPDGTTYAQVGAPEKGDAYTALMMFSNQVINPRLALEDRQTALHFIVHIIGDLHQPLHVGNGKDRGGNDVRLEFFWERSNLHRIWDSGIIEQQKLSYTEYTDWLSRKMTPATVQTWMEADPMVWIKESYDIRQGIYTENEKENYRYVYQHLDTVNLRLAQGGVRIAAYLNQLFGTGK